MQRDSQFDDAKLRSAGIRLLYETQVPQLSGIKEGILLELGFDDTAPNRPVTISSWPFAQRFRTGDEQVIAKNPAFLFTDAELLQRYTLEFQRTSSLYYQEQLDSPELIQRIHENLDVM